MISQAVQDYLKTIYKIEKEDESSVSTTRIAKELNISGASVTGMLKRLSAMGLASYNSYKGVKLTDKGRKVALEILRHHRLLELYLKEELGFTLDKVHEEACRLEHHISKEFLEKIDSILGNPQFDPHGHPIPSKEGNLPESNEIPLVNLTPGKVALISRISDYDMELLGYLEKLGLIPGVEVKILEKAPFNGPITLKYNGEEKIIGNEVAGNIFVDNPDKN
jgi:DtxR family Mn-dependent transcriptional regulator